MKFILILLLKLAILFITIIVIVVVVPVITIFVVVSVRYWCVFMWNMYALLQMEKKIVTLTTDNKLSYSDLMEDLVHKLGGCGRYQCLTGFIVQSAKTMVAMSMIAMAFMGQQPDFRCRGRLRTSDQSEMFDNECKNNNGTCVEGYEFESYENSMKTIVTEVRSHSIPCLLLLL